MELEMANRRFRNAPKAACWRDAAYSIAYGLFGTLLIIGLLCGVMPVSDTVKHLPWILAFCGSVSGYTLLDRTRSRLRRQKRAGAAVGAAIGAGICILMNLAAWKLAGIILMGAPEIAFFTLIAGSAGGLGAALAVKYVDLNTTHRED